MSTLDVTDDVNEEVTSEPNITTTVEVEDEPVENEPVEDDQSFNSHEELESCKNRIKILEERFEKLNNNLIDFLNGYKSGRGRNIDLNKFHEI